MVLHGFYGYIQFVGDLPVFQVFKAAQLEDGAALFRQFIQGFPELLFQFF